jgi:hypothetical protein
MEMSRNLKTVCTWPPYENSINTEIVGKHSMQQDTVDEHNRYR